MSYTNNSKIAYVAVHLGFGKDLENSMTKAFELIRHRQVPNLNKEEWAEFLGIPKNVVAQGGNYDEYFENIKLVLNYMTQKRNGPSSSRQHKNDKPYFINVVERRVRRIWSNYQRKLLSIPKGDITIVTKDGHSEIRKILRGRRKINLDSLYDLLKKDGIGTLAFFGEYVWIREKGRGRACLGGIVNRFSKSGLKIASVEGCIFPSERPKNLDDEVINALYSNTVPIPN